MKGLKCKLFFCCLSVQMFQCFLQCLLESDTGAVAGRYVVIVGVSPTSNMSKTNVADLVFINNFWFLKCRDSRGGDKGRQEEE